MQHDWIKSTLGHGDLMCRRCFVTNLEAAAIGMAECEPPPPKAANQNAPERQWTQEEIDAEQEQYLEDDLSVPGDECGRWRNGSLGQYCAKAGTEECDFECPYRDSECVKC